MAPVPRLILVWVAFLAAALPVRADEGVRVPDVQGRTQEKAIERLAEVGLEARIIQVAGPEVEVVDSQRPEAGTTLSKGSPVFLRVGILARIKTTVPNVKGRSVGDALELLGGAYDVHVRPERTTTVAAGTVIRSEPASGAPLYYRARLVLVVAEADADAEPDTPGPTEPTAAEGGLRLVPCAVGLRPKAARTMLEADGYEVVVRSRWAADAKPGHVVAQDPPADRPAVPGQLVTLYLPRMIQAPSVVGLTHMDAVRELAKYGIAGRFDPRPDAARLDARVVEQRPEADAYVVVGSAVVLRFEDDADDGGVWNEDSRAFVEVPDVRGLAPDAARKSLEAAGFSSTFDRQEGDPLAGPVVTAMSQSPKAWLRKGATITLLAGAFGLDARQRRPGAFVGAVGGDGEKPKPGAAKKGG